MSDFSGLEQNDKLQRFYNKRSRLPTKPIPSEIGEGEDKNETPQNRAVNAKVTHSDIKAKR